MYTVYYFTFYILDFFYREKMFNLLLSTFVKQNRVVKQFEREKLQAKTISSLLTNDKNSAAATASLLTNDKNSVATSAPLLTNDKNSVAATSSILTNNKNSAAATASLLTNDNNSAAATASLLTNDKNSFAATSLLLANDKNSAMPLLQTIDKNDAVVTASPQTNANSSAVDSSSGGQMLTADMKKRDSALRLAKPVDFDDFWYKGDDGKMYNEYNDELEPGYYYEDDEKSGNLKAESKAAELKIADSQQPAGLPRPTDYDDFWYEGDDGKMYNEYDDELEEGQFYADPKSNTMMMNGTAANYAPTKDDILSASSGLQKAEKSKKKDEVLMASDAGKAAEEAAKAAEEAAKAAAEASKNLLKGMSGLGSGLLGSMKADTSKQSQQSGGFGFGLGGLFGSSEPEKKQLASVKPSQIKPEKPAPSAAAATSAPAVVPALAPAAAATAVAPAPAAKPAPAVKIAPAAVELPEEKVVINGGTKAGSAVSGIATAVEPTNAADLSSVPAATDVLTADKQASTAESTSRRPGTTGFSARQRWKWSYAMVKKVKKKGKERVALGEVQFPTGQASHRKYSV